MARIGVRAFLLVLSTIAASASWAQETITVYGLKGPSGIGMAKLFESPPAVSGASIAVEALSGADLMAARFISGEAKIGILPPNVAAKIFAAGKPVAAAAVVGEGMLSLVASDRSIASIADLKGREVYVAGQGATPDFVFRKILSGAGLDPEKDVALRYSMAYPEMAAALIAGRISVAVLPEPFATMALKGSASLSVPVDIQREWAAAGGSAQYPMTVLAVNTLFADSHPEALAAVMAAYKDSVAWVVANPAEAGKLVEKLDLGLKAPIAAAAIPRSAYVFIPAKDARPDLEALFKVFLSYAPASIGGKLPDDRFYR